MSDEDMSSSAFRKATGRVNAVLSAESIKIVKATAPVVAPRAEELTKHFYGKMFKNNPEVLAFFNQANQKKERGQPQALAHAVVAYASNIENLGVLGSAVEAMAVKHCGLQVLPEHYSIVHDNLLASIADLFGDAITPEVGAGWSEAVNYLAMILINREEELYAEAEQREGGWRGWKEFVVSERISRTKDVVSWSFKRTDAYAGNFDFTAGQFLSIKLDAEKLKSATPIAPRHYTITSRPGEDHLQCTVKRIEGGVVSNWMHDNLMQGDVVMLAPPFGMFTPKPDTKAVLISAGIGITPMIAMIKHFPKEEIAKIVHVDRSAEYPFKSFLEDSCKDKVSSFVRTGDSAAIDDVVAAALENGTEHTFYLCGPPGFMAEMVPALKQKGCKHVEHEVFGPQLAGLSCPMRSQAP